MGKLMLFGYNQNKNGKTKMNEKQINEHIYVGELNTLAVNKFVADSA